MYWAKCSFVFPLGVGIGSVGARLAPTVLRLQKDVCCSLDWQIVALDKLSDPENIKIHKSVQEIRKEYVKQEYSFQQAECFDVWDPQTKNCRSLRLCSMFRNIESNLGGKNYW